MRGFLAGLLLALCMLVPGVAFGAETIRSFETVLIVQTDGSVAITETITVNAEGVDIRRGIFRDVPTVLLGPSGQAVRSDLAVQSVTRNGRAEPFATESMDNGVRIRIGSANALLERGVHRYEIRYTMTRAVRFFEDHDELYWNATGNFWQFPIERASSVVTLPEGGRITALNVFTGAQGATGSAARIEEINARQARFTTTRPLGAYEGMTVAVAFEKGLVAAPEGSDAVWYWLSDNRNLIVPSALLVLVLLYNTAAWAAVGRDPAKGVIFPRFYPPKGFSPALVHYVYNMGWKNSGWTAFSAALVALATKGLVEIDKSGRTRLTATGRQPETPLPPSEKIIFDHIRVMSPVTIDKTTGPEFARRLGEMRKALETENRLTYFRRNAGWVVIGAVLAIAALGVMAFLGVIDPLILFITAFFSVFISMLALGLRSIWKGPILGRVISTFVIAMVIFNGGAAVLELIDLTRIDYPIVAAISIVAVTLFFAVIMRAPTVHGRKVMDEIEGFRLYLDTAEKERLNFTGEPEMSVLRFETILPYAMALGVEKPWSERFEGDLARNAISDAPAGGYSPHWYHGGNFSSQGIARSLGGVGTGLSAAMMSAQPASSSSSGFSGGGGGGFSGGGGGGGGGGGW